VQVGLVLEEVQVPPALGLGVVDAGGLGDGVGAGHRIGRGAGRAGARARRGRLGGDPGGQQARRAVGGGDPGQRAQRHLPGQLDLAGLPAPAASAVRDSVFAGVAAAQRLGSVWLGDSVRAAFVDSTDGMLWVCTAIAVAGVVLALVFLPGRAATAGRQQAEPATLEDEVSARG